jgi:hypothetical protein
MDIKTLTIIVYDTPKYDEQAFVRQKQKYWKHHQTMPFHRLINTHVKLLHIPIFHSHQMEWVQ